MKRGDIPNRVVSDLATKPPAQRPTSLNLSKDAFDRMLDNIMAHMQSDSPRTLAKLSIWQKASQANSEFRTLLKLDDRQDDEEESNTAPAGRDPSFDFFPPEWSSCLSEEMLAELIVDAFISGFSDAFIDAGVSLVEVSSKWTAAQSASGRDFGASMSSSSFGGLQQSQSEPSLQQPKTIRKLRNTMHTDKALLRMGLSEQETTSTEGFTMNGLTKDSWEAWNARNYHKCKPLDPFMTRIENATRMQRPHRQLVKRVERDSDQRKYLWPMAKTNFPEAWNKATYKPRSRHIDYEEEYEDDEPPPGWLLRLKGGKTTFPYSLVSHRAFLDSLPDPVLKEKARKLAPLRLTHP